MPPVSGIAPGRAIRRFHYGFHLGLPDRIQKGSDSQAEPILVPTASRTYTEPFQTSAIGQERTCNVAPPYSRIHAPMINIRSCTSNRGLRISYARDSYLLVELAGFPVSASVEVWVETGDAARLQAFLADLGKQERPWNGMREWQSIEDDFNLSATCTPLGHVVFNVQMHGLQGAPEEWAVTAGIDYELGRLASLSSGLDFENTTAHR